MHWKDDGISQLITGAYQNIWGLEVKYNSKSNNTVAFQYHRLEGKFMIAGRKVQKSRYRVSRCDIHVLGYIKIPTQRRYR
jgi:hypothetical protein